MPHHPYVVARRPALASTSKVRLTSLLIERAVHALATAVQDVREAHGGRDLLMPEQLLDGALVLAAVRQVRGKRVAQVVKTKRL